VKTRQREALERAGVNAIFEEKASGTKRDGRTELQKVLSVLGDGDVLVVTRLDRVGRSLRDLANIAHEIEQAGAYLKVIEQSVDTSTAAGRAFYGMLNHWCAVHSQCLIRARGLLRECQESAQERSRFLYPSNLDPGAIDPDHCGEFLRHEGGRGEGAGLRLRRLRDQTLQPRGFAPPCTALFGGDGTALMSGLWVRFRVVM
jgi:hypothetical protein